MSNILIGSHVKMCAPNYILGSLSEAISYGANCFMFYNGAPQNLKRIDIEKLNITEFQNQCSKNNINLNNIVIHAPYIINLATSDKSKNEYTLNILKNEIERTKAIGINKIVFHPGSNIDKIQGIINVSNIINNINHTFNDDVILCIESMAGKGNEICSNLDEIALLISKITNKKLIGVCLDTCHLNDSGYNIKDIDNFLNEFDKKIGLSYLKVIHLNDSKNVINSKKDRHENIGKGTIGFDVLCSWATNKKLVNIIKILETPYVNNKPIYKDEIKAIRIYSKTK